MGQCTAPHTLGSGDKHARQLRIHSQLREAVLLASGKGESTRQGDNANLWALVAKAQQRATPSGALPEFRTCPCDEGSWMHRLWVMKHPEQGLV